MGENKEYNNAVASLIVENDTNARLKDIEIHDFKPMDFLPAKGVDNVRVGVITYDPKIDDFNQIESVFKNKFDCMDIIIHVSDRKTLMYEKIKKFYDTFNEAWVGKDKYKEMIYSPRLEDKDKMWHYLLAQTLYKHHLPRTIIFIYNGKRLELKTNKEFNEIDEYVMRMPDSRSVIQLDLNDKNAFKEIALLMGEICDRISEDISLQKIEKLLSKSDELEKTVAKEQQENAKMSSKQIGLICSLTGIGAISTAVAGVLIKKKLSSKPKITKPEVKNKEIKNLKNNKLLT
jgi:hypothetical protein